MPEKDKSISNKNKRYYKDLDKKSSHHTGQLNRINREKSNILKADGYKDSPHWWVWVLVFVAIAVAILWYFLYGKNTSPGSWLPNIPKFK
jgi:carbohydrate-binding DOMON domain-containing protein